MYRIKRENGRVVIFDWQGNAIYKAEDGDLVLYRDNGVLTAKVGDLNDHQLLAALATAVKLPL